MTLRIPDAALAQHVAILGMTGSGKTFAAKGAVESLLDAGRQCCIIDPTGAWWGLRLARDGKARGHDVILLGGDHADIALSERSGGAVARLVAEQRASVVIDTSGMAVGEYTRWFIDFAGDLYRLNRHPLHLVIDEAHTFAPQGGAKLSPDTAKMLHATNRLMSGGRSRGIRAMLITQRPAKLHKDSLTCASTLVAMRVIAPQDRGAIKDWIDGAGDAKQGRDVLDSLAQLHKGEGWVWYPEGRHLERGKFPAIKTFDSSATPTGDDRPAVRLGEINLDAVKSAMAEAVAEAEANDPKALRARIAELERKLRDVKPGHDQAAIDRACAARDEHWRSVVDAQLSRLAASKSAMERIMPQLGEAFGALGKWIETLDTNAAELRAAEIIGTKQPRTEFNTSAKPDYRITKSDKATPGNVTTPKSLSRSQKFLDAAASLQRLKAECSRETVSAWVGVHPRGGSVGETLADLAASGLIHLDRGKITVTASGLALAKPVSVGDAIENAKRGLSDRQARFLSDIMAAYPGSISREQIAAKHNLHPRGGSLGEDLSALVGRGLVTSSRGVYTARSFLFGA